MKKLLPIVLSLLFTQQSIVFAQWPGIEWQKSYGGSSSEELWSVAENKNGGYALAGYSSSSNGDVTLNHGNIDFWVVKVDDTGGLQWQHSFGGSNGESARSISNTYDGGFIIAGSTSSTDGDVTDNHGGQDYWVIKLDAAGNPVWKRCYGGTGDEFANAVIQASDSGYIVTGQATSTNGDLTENYGSYDLWTIKLDPAGNIQWETIAGGSGGDAGSSIEQVIDGYVVTGRSASCDSDITNCRGSSDIFIVKYDNAGNKQWTRSYGGSGSDESFSIKQTNDNGYIIAGATNSSDGDVSSFQHGSVDSWILKLGSTGNLEWEKCFGGSEYEKTYSIGLTSDNSYIVTGTTYSGNFDVTGYHGNGANDAWVLKINDTGTIIWDRCFGGNYSELGRYGMQTNDGKYLLAASSGYIDGDVTTMHGSFDFWIVKFWLAPTTTGLENIQPSTSSILISPNPSKGHFTVTIPGNTGKAGISIVNMIGQEVTHKDFMGPVIDISVPGVAGIYFVKLSFAGDVNTSKLVIE